MIITAEQIEQRLLGIWPNLYHRWLSDRRTWSPGVNEFSTRAVSLGIHKLKPRKGYLECEEFARMFQGALTRLLVDEANAKRQSGGAVPIDLSLSWAFGRAKGMNFPHVKRGISHDLIFLIPDDGVVRLYEPQTCQIWIPDVSMDENDENFVYFVEM